MKRRLVDLLSCPTCGGSLALSVFSTRAVPHQARFDRVRCARTCALRGGPVATATPRIEAAVCEGCYGEDVTQGLLRCRGCGQSFPVIDSVPRMLPTALDDHREWVERWRSRLDGVVLPVPAERHVFEGLFQRTQKSFELEWLTFRETWDDNLRNFERRTGFTPAELTGRTLLDVGCGMGRYLRLLGDVPDCEVVGLDLGRAVERAQAEVVPRSPLLHVLQGNLMTAPFRSEIFDLVYSLGVLHHTPSTEKAFESITRLVRPGGHLAIWVYACDMLRHPLRLWVSDTLRVVTTRMPPRLIYHLSFIAGPLGWLQEQLLRRPLTTWLGVPLLVLPVRIRAPWRIRVMDTYDWYSPQFQWKHTRDEVRAWFERAGFVEVRANAENVSYRGLRPRTVEP